MGTPLDHVAIGHDRVCDANGRPHIVCQLWPECRCPQNCADMEDARMVWRLFLGFIAAVLAIAGGLIFWGMHS
ncbi:hypothetical protein [Mesorhizobium sp. NZP2077]|uniref:hypothetical protein n=1 Tax=Mesorhizobium sp. NZP2077 TaxID=2483404 RepID=UPI0015536DA8|nr:hypothetical protein [Mesorhizobium sp. NZP2077]QKC83238.1 hypothetical protein EB232_17920 [Mesorhizobium sp. NZP2077]QKD16755.1 hypothetical protein HGP13_17705 [Mesorhizobium sp. NZP2077]